MSYENKKMKLLNESREQTKTIKDILKQDEDKLIFSSAIRDKIIELQKKSLIILKKLEKDEFEIAIIGQEDSGKSSLLNALIKTDIFPSGSGRTTYTSTKLISGKEDKVEVTLFSYDEFDKIFIDRLNSIKIYDNFKGLTLAKFKTKFNKLSIDIREKAKEKNIFSDIEEILEDKDKINQLLKSKGGRILDFTKNNLKDFKLYVTGEESDKSKPRATKEIKIFSSKLQAMPNAIIYDVPGFNSPTKLHKEQTIKMLKEADSIIFISDVTSPNLKDNELETLSNGNDKYGVLLKDKLFVFGNKHDKANNHEEAEENEIKFVNDVLDKKSISDKKRVFVGSAGKYLVDEKIGNLDISFPYDIDSNIDSFRQSIEEYYKFDRFEVLKNKIENIEEEIISIFKEIREKVSLPESVTENYLKQKITIDTNTKIRKALEDNLNNIKIELKEEYKKNEYFSDGFKKEIPNFFKNIVMSDVNQYIPRYEDNFDRINSQIRDNLYNQFLKDFTNLVIKLVDTPADSVEKRVFTAFVSAIKDTKEIRKKAKNIFKFEKQSGKFDYLFERFGRKLLDLIIYNPVLSSKREMDFKESKNEFIYLDTRYKNDGSIINIAISGKNEPISSNLLIDTFAKEFINSLNILKNSSIENFIEKCENNLMPKLENILENNSTKHFDEKELFSKRKGNYSKEDIVNEINRDIDNFKEVLINAIIPILDLETIFIKRVEKEIKVLISRLDNEDIKNFILESIEIYAEKEFLEIDKRVKDFENKRDILNLINNFLKGV